MISFAIGGLLGDVFFHTLPHLSSGHSDTHESHGHEHSHDHSGHGHAHNPKDMENNMIIITGIVTFFFLEKIIHNYLEGGH